MSCLRIDFIVSTDAAFSVEEALQSDVVDMLSHLKDANATDRIINIVIDGVNKIMEKSFAVVGVGFFICVMHV